MSEPTRDLAAIEAERDRIKAEHLREPGARIELIADPLGEMYGSQVL